MPNDDHHTDTDADSDTDSIVDAVLDAASEYPVLDNADHEVDERTVAGDPMIDVRFIDGKAASAVAVRPGAIEEFGTFHLDAMCKRAAEALMANKQEARNNE